MEEPKKTWETPRLQPLDTKQTEKGAWFPVEYTNTVGGTTGGPS